MRYLSPRNRAAHLTFFSLFVFILSLLVTFNSTGGFVHAFGESLPDSVPTAFDCGTVNQIPNSECTALLGLYNNTNGANWSTRTGWLATTTPCSWHGIICLNGHVSEVRLSKNNLVGAFPSELLSLPNLQVIQIAENQLTGSLPNQIGTLSNLYYLAIWGNQLSGSLPTSLGNLTNLTNLYMGKNQFTGSIPSEMGNLTKLTVWICDRNQLTGSIPAGIGNLVNLNTLILERNRLSGVIPPEIGNLTKLTTLAMWGNQLDGQLPASLGNLTNLTGFFMGINRFTGSIPSSLGNLTKLTTFYLDGNQLSGEIPPSLANLTAATTFNLDYNMLTASDATLRNFLAQKDPTWATTQTLPPTDVRVTSTTSNTVRLEWTPIAYTADSGWYKIEYATNAAGPFSLHGETFTKSNSDYAAKNLASSTTYYFRIRTYSEAHDKNWENNLTSVPSPVVSTQTAAGQAPFACDQVSEIPTTECSALVRLYEATNGAGWSNRSGWLSNNAPCTWIGIACSNGHITNIDLSSNNLVGILPIELRNLTTLRQLKLVSNQIGGEIPTQLGTMTSLIAIDLYDNKLSGAIPVEFGNLANLEYLSLSRNLLTGAIPAQLGSLTKLTFLSLSVNNLTGAIPEALTSLTSLQQVRLQKTQLSGAIPTDLNKLTQLNQLWLADTQLSGSLPESFTALTQLKDFDFQNTNLCVPQTTAFQSWLATITTLKSNGVQCTTEVGDSFEIDNTCASAVEITTNGLQQTHTFHAANDRDWVKFNAQAFQTYVIDVVNLGAKADATLELYDKCDGAATSQNNGSFGSQVRMEWNSLRTAVYFLKLQQFDPAIAGSDTNYQVSITVDNTPPSAPRSVRCISIDTTRLGLQWRRSPEYDVNRYRISYSGSGLSGSDDVDGSDTTYHEVTGLVAQQSYTMRVRALDFAGNESLPSGEVVCAVKTPDDVSKPLVTLQQPDEAQAISTTQTLIDFLGLVQDVESNVSRVQVRNLTSNSEKWDYSLTGKSDTFRVEDVNLAIGDNQVQISAFDSAGNRTDKSLVIKRLGETAGAVVIVAGRNEVNSLQLNIYNAANRVYRIFRSAGYSAENIYYLAPVAQDADNDTVNDVDANAGPAELQNALTVWAKEGNKIGANKPLFVYMIDHGLSEIFCVDGCAGNGQVTPVLLDGWLRTLETDTGVSEVTVVIEACLSGSFLDRAAGNVASSLSKSGRVVITSTGANNNAYASAQGAYFSDAFFSCIADSSDLKSCFEQGRAAVVATGVNQTPWLDDNGDGLATTADGDVAKTRIVTKFFSSIRPKIVAATVERNGANGTLNATIEGGAETLDLVWAAIYPPSFQEPSDITINLSVPIVRLEVDPNNEKTYRFVYNNGFPEAGDYRVVFYAQDRSGIHAIPKVAGEAEAPSDLKVFLPLVSR